MINRVTMVLLLLVVGMGIYLMSAPKNTENMDEEESNPSLMQSLFGGLGGSDDEEEQVQEANTTDTIQDTETGLEDQDFSGFESDNGADLANAFASAVPAEATVDEIDFNRNNVTEFNSKQYLPQESNEKWFDTDFTKAKYNLNDDTMINTDRYVIGVNTVGQSLKNGSHDLRGTIPNPKYSVSPWNNSSYEPDNNIKSWC